MEWRFGPAPGGNPVEQTHSSASSNAEAKWSSGDAATLLPWEACPRAARTLLASRQEAEQEPDHKDPDAHPDKPPVRAPHPDQAEERPRPQEADPPGQVVAATLSAPAGGTKHRPVPAYPRSRKRLTPSRQERVMRAIAFTSAPLPMASSKEVPSSPTKRRFVSETADAGRAANSPR